MTADGGCPSPPIIRSVMMAVSAWVRTKTISKPAPKRQGTSMATDGSFRTPPSSATERRATSGWVMLTCLFNRIDRVEAPAVRATDPLSTRACPISGANAPPGSIIIPPLPCHPGLR
ncbi:hypothetical protein D3C72_1969190 [compost metagenome]